MPAQPVTGPTRALTSRRLRTAFGDELAPLISLSQAAPYLGLTRSAAYRRALRDPDSIPGLRGRRETGFRVVTATMLSALDVDFEWVPTDASGTTR